ncbi:hypothetical protein GCM10010522_49300 [Kribbella solani]|uniref:Uncharacterized protein n=1 Tax=Kribbella solani TaxID=236067 RepID=A0A841E083_9ACTN|nr:hypothetical protein [Kribbella solani]
MTPNHQPLTPRRLPTPSPHPTTGTRRTCAGPPCTTSDASSRCAELLRRSVSGCRNRMRPADRAVGGAAGLPVEVQGCPLEFPGGNPAFQGAATQLEGCAGWRAKVQYMLRAQAGRAQRSRMCVLTTWHLQYVRHLTFVRYLEIVSRLQYARRIQYVRRLQVVAGGVEQGQRGWGTCNGSVGWGVPGVMGGRGGWRVRGEGWFGGDGLGFWVEGLG